MSYLKLNLLGRIYRQASMSTNRKSASSDAGHMTRLRTALTDGLVVIDAFGKILHVNNWVSNTTGYDPEQLVGESIETLLSEGAEGESAAFTQAFAQGAGALPVGQTSDLYLRKRNGRKVHVDIELSPVCVGEEKIVAVTVRGRRDRSSADARRRLELRHQQVIGRLASDINLARPLFDIYERLADELRKVIPFDRASVTERTDDGSFIVEFSAGETVSRMDDRDLEGLIAESFPNAREVNGALLSSIDKRPDDDHPACQAMFDRGIRSMMAAPLGNPLFPEGHLIVRSGQSHAYNDAHARLLSTIGFQLGPAIRNARLGNGLKKVIAEQAAVAKIARTVSTSMNIEQVWDAFVRQVKTLLPADRIVLTEFIDEDNTLIDSHVWGVTSPTHPSGKINTNTSVGRAIKRGEPFIDDLTNPKIAEQGKLPELRSAMFVPLRLSDRIIGSLNIKSKDANAYSQRDLNLMSLLADQIAGAIAAERAHTALLESAAVREEQIRTESENRRLAGEVEFKSKLISTVSHELRTPLTAMLAMADTLKRNRQGNLNERQIEQIGVIRNSGRRLFLLTNDLLTASTIDAGKLKVAMDRIDLEQVMGNVVRSVTPIFENKEQKLIVSCEPGLEVYADKIRLEQVLSNLLSNASKYSPEGSISRMTAVADDDRVVVSVADNGQGISDEDQEKLFDTYFRSDDKATHSEVGAGLGLYIVKMLVEAQGGEVDVESEYGLGSTFSVSLKRPSEALESEANEDAA